MEFFNKHVDYKFDGVGTVDLCINGTIIHALSDTGHNHYICKECGLVTGMNSVIITHMQNHFVDKLVYYAVVYPNLADYAAIYFFMNKYALSNHINNSNNYLEFHTHEIYEIKKGIRKTDFRAYMRVKNNIKLTEGNN